MRNRRAVEADQTAFERYVAPAISRRTIDPHHRFVVNSVPKSGTVWMMAMLAHLLQIDLDSQVCVSHVCDVAEFWSDPSVLGTVTVVRDMRDVVISWFHEVARDDCRAGFAAPRYPDVEAFYFEYLLGFLRSSPRYAHGHFEDWLDAVSARSVPIVRYEDMIVDTPAALRKVLNFWKITIPEEAISETTTACSFANIRKTAVARSRFVAGMIQSGHLRRGAVGSWREELPASVADDVMRQFGAYQARLRY